MTVGQINGEEGTCTKGCSRNEREKLVEHLLHGYIKGVEPNPTPVKFSLNYVCASYAAPVLTSRVWEYYSWTDERLTWKPSDYSDIRQIRIPAKDIWTPDFRLYNSFKELEERDEVNVVLKSDGSVLWVPIATYKTLCAADDTCSLVLGSWTYDANILKLQLEGTGFDASSYMNTCPYVIHDPQVKVESKIYPCCPGDPYASYTVDFKVSPRE
jgi:hypothetical protein